MISRLWKRFIEDCTLFVRWLRGELPNDELLPYEMAAHMAKYQLEEIDWDTWEAERFAAHPNAVWFDPHRYDDTPYGAWPKKEPKVVPASVHDRLLSDLAMTARRHGYNNACANAAAQQALSYAYQQHNLQLAQADWHRANQSRSPLIAYGLNNLLGGI